MDERHANETGDAIEISAEILQVFRRVQQVLLTSGYTYLAADAERWPLTPVLMTKDERILLIDFWHPELFAGNMARWQTFVVNERNAGLLLVGAEGIESPLLDEFFINTRGAIAYVDARTDQYRVSPLPAWARNSPTVLREAELARALRPEAAAGAADIDCPAAIRRDLAAVERANAYFSETLKLNNVTRAPLTHLLIAACVLIYLGTLMASQQIAGKDALGQALLGWGALAGTLVRQGEWWRILTAGFLHAGNVHLLMNMLALYFLGVQLENQQGPWRLSALFLFSIILGNLFSLMWLPHVLSVGASGGIFGLVGAYAAMPVRFREEMPLTLRKSLFRWLGTIICYNLMIAFIPGVNWLAHVGGLLGGFLLGVILLRSPLNATPPKWAPAALLALLAATLLFGYIAVMRIPG